MNIKGRKEILELIGITSKTIFLKSEANAKIMNNCGCCFANILQALDRMNESI